jgi:DNA-binding NarL/FixJ family response regulator
MHWPDLLILDFVLPGADGIHVARELHVLNPQARVIVLPSCASSVGWPFELRDQLLALIDKSRAFKAVTAAILKASCPSRPSPTPKQIWSQLTQREWDVLMQLDRGLSSQAIASTLQIWVRTVQTHRHNIGSKMILNGAALIHLATLVRGQVHQGAPLP